MKLKNLFILVFTIIVAISLSLANGDENSGTKKTTEKKACCPKDAKMATGKTKAECSDAKHAHKSSKDCITKTKDECKDAKHGSMDCCKKDGKMSKDCSPSEKEKCDKSKAEMKDCPMGKAKTTETK